MREWGVSYIALGDQETPLGSLTSVKDPKVKTTHWGKQPMRWQVFRVRGNGKKVRGWGESKERRGRISKRRSPTLSSKADSFFLINVSNFPREKAWVSSERRELELGKAWGSKGKGVSVEGTFLKGKWVGKEMRRSGRGDPHFNLKQTPTQNVKFPKKTCGKTYEWVYVRNVEGLTWSVESTFLKWRGGERKRGAPHEEGPSTKLNKNLKLTWEGVRIP
jgi:hypothetical protein